jgi:hypothetical protein
MAHVRLETQEESMAMTERALAGSGNGEPFAEAVGGIVTVILAILGLAHVIPNYLVPITTIVFGAVLLGHGAGLLSQLARPGIAMPAARVGSGVSAVFLVGAGGIVLGILALVGIDPLVLSACAVIAYGAVLVLSANSTVQVHTMQAARTEGVPGGGMMAEEVISETGGFLAMAGLAAVVLGILALAGFAQAVLILVALLALGAAIVATGGALTTVMMTFFRTT